MLTICIKQVDNIVILLYNGLSDFLGGLINNGEQ